MQEGWYSNPDGSGRLMFWNGHAYVDPYVEFEAHVTDLLIPALERMFEMGFEAGVDTAAKLSALKDGLL